MFTFGGDDDDLFTHPGADEGERNATLCRLVGKHFGRGDHYATIRTGVLQWASRCSPAYDEDEALKVFDAIAKKENANADDHVEDDEEQKLSGEAYHGIVGDYVRAIEPHTEADAGAILVSSLIAIGNVIGNKPFFVTDGDVHHANLFGVFVGESGNARKGVSLKRALALLDDDFRHRNVVNGLSSGEGLINAVRDAVTKFDVASGKVEIIDEGVTDKRLLVTETELASTLKVVKREGNTLSPIIRLAFDGMTLTALTKQRQVATGAHVSIIAHITERELKKTLSETETFNGFANRFLWLRSRRSKYLPDGGDFVDVEPYRQRIRKAIAKAQTVGEMKRSEAAKTLWRSLYVDALNSEHPVLTRAAAITLRLSMIYALLDESNVIEDVHLHAAYAVWRYAQQSVLSIFGNGDDDAFESKVCAKVVEQPGVSRKELYDAFGRNTPMKLIDAALHRLEAKRKVYAKKDATTCGRPAERWYPATKTTTTTHATPERRNAESTTTPTSGVSGVPASNKTPTPDAMTFTFGGEGKMNCQTPTPSASSSATTTNAFYAPTPNATMTERESELWNAFIDGDLESEAFIDALNATKP